MAIGKKMEKAKQENAAKAEAKDPQAEAPVAPVSIPPDASVSGSEGATVPSPFQLTADQQAEIDRIMAQAKAAAQQVILGGSPEAKLGTPSGNVEEKQEHFQRDYLPGKLLRDKTRVPERIYDEDKGIDRQVLLHNEYRYALVPQDDFLTYTGLGYKFVKFDGGSQSGLTERGFRGTGDAIFTRTLSGNCQRGDCFYMYIPIRGWEALREEDQYKASEVHKKALGVFHNVAYASGIRPEASISDDQGNLIEKIF